MLVLDAKRGHLMDYLFKMKRGKKKKFNTGQVITYECKSSSLQVPYAITQTPLQITVDQYRN